MPELCCLEPSSLNRPHPPHSWAHRIFTAWRLIRDAFAVRERLGDPRVVPGFRYPFCPGIPSSPTPGSSIIVISSAAMSTRPSPRVDRLGTPKTPAIRFTRAMTFVASWFTHLLRSASLLAPCTDLTGYPASGAFTSGLSAGWSPFSLQDITTTATGLLCWRDSHPLEWQLASLHLLLHRSGLAPPTPCRSPGAREGESAEAVLTCLKGWRAFHRLCERNFLPFTPKWIGRCDPRGVKLLLWSWLINAIARINRPSMIFTNQHRSY